MAVAKVPAFPDHHPGGDRTDAACGSVTSQSLTDLTCWASPGLVTSGGSSRVASLTYLDLLMFVSDFFDFSLGLHSEAMLFGWLDDG